MIQKDKLEIGTLLTAIDECIMEFENTPALIIGNEYEVISINENSIFINSHQAKNHEFEIKSLHHFFSMAEDEIVKIKKYTIEHHCKANGDYKVVRTCDGFNALELLGIMELTRDSIVKQIAGYLPQPTEVEKNIVKDNKINKQ